MADIFATHAPAFWSRGIPAIPLVPGQKRPAIDAWQMFSDSLPTEEQKARWLGEFAHANIGLALGPQAGIEMLDVDTDDPKVHQLIESVLPRSPWRRFGRKGFALAFRWSGHRTFRVKRADEATILELLSSKTQLVLPPSIHPDTGLPYRANVDLLEVYDDLPPLPKDVEIILREGLKELGYELSANGFTKLTEWVAPGARDNRMIQVAGLYANTILRGEVTFLEAVAQMRGWHDARVEKVAGDDVDINKGIVRMAEFLVSDVTGDKRRMLPVGWDAGLSGEMKSGLGLSVITDDNQEWTPEQVRIHLDAALAALPPEDLRRVDEVNKALDRIARQQFDALHEEQILRWIAETSMTGISFTSLKRRLRELRQGEVVGTDHSEIADQVLSDLRRFGEVRFAFSKFWSWTGSHWERKVDEDIYRHIADNYGSLPAAKKANDHSGIHRVMGRKVSRPLVNTAMVGINFANGYLTQDGRLLPHEPAYGATYCLPYRYLPELADRCPRWLAFLNDRWARDADREAKITALQEAMCATLMGFAPRLQRAVLLVGVARSGKSQVLKVMRGLLPEEAVSNIPPNTWGDKFMPVGFVGKLLNVAGELSESKYIQGDIFKQVVEGESIPVQYKGKDSFDIRPVCAHWFGSNHLPRTRDTSEGFNRRWLILTFNHPVPLEDVQLDFADILIAEEREAITAWAIQAMPRLVRQNGYTLPTSHAQAVEAMADANDSVRFFMKQKGIGVLCLSSGPTSSTQLYTEYYRFCAEAGDARPVTLRNFIQRMENLASVFNFTPVSQKDKDGNTQVLFMKNTSAMNIAAA